jgi:hypothetical protein
MVQCPRRIPHDEGYFSYCSKKIYLVTICEKMVKNYHNNSRASKRKAVGTCNTLYESVEYVDFNTYSPYSSPVYSSSSSPAKDSGKGKRVDDNESPMDPTLVLLLADIKKRRETPATSSQVTTGCDSFSVLLTELEEEQQQAPQQQ